jgi:Domain of unknown function (DUF4386)
MLSTARLAGVLYAVVVVTGIFSLAYVPAQYTVAGDEAATMAKIVATEPMFRAGIAAAVVCYLAFMLLPLALYRLFRFVDPVAAQLMVAFALVSIPMALLNLGRRLDVLDALQAGDTARGAELLAAYGNGLEMVQLFWGLWLLPLGWLVLRSAAIPRVLGVFLVLGCFGYLINVFGGILMPGFADLDGVRYISIPRSIGEIGTCLWLLIMGAREDRLQAPAR